MENTTPPEETPDRDNRDGAARDPQPAEPAPGSRSRRRAWKIAAWIVGPLVVLALVIFVLPTYAARYVLRGQLADLGITAEGVDTLRIDVWNREIWLGPVQFHAEQAPIGEVAEIGLRYGVLNLFQRQALIRELIIKGVDIQITRELDGNFIVNGVDLARLTKPKAEQPPPPPEDEKKWGAGLDDFRFIDSRIFYTDRARGTVELDVDNLELHEFRTWQPDHPGNFLLDARVNNIDFQAKGTARPFGEVIHADFTTTIDGVEMDKISKYTGPLGFERRAGVLGAALDGTVEASGGALDASLKGEITGTGVDANRPGQIAVQFDRAAIKLDNRLRMAKDGSRTVSGPFHVELNGTLLTVAGGTTVAFAKGALDLPALEAKMTEGASAATTRGSLALAGLEAKPTGAGGKPGPTVTAVNFATDLKDISINAGGSTTKLGGNIDLTIDDLQAGLPVDGAAEGQRVAADQAKLSLANLAVNAAGAETTISATGKTDVSGLSAKMPKTRDKPPVDASIGHVHLDLSEINAALGKADPQWQVAVDAALNTLAATVGGGDLAKASLGDITLKNARANHALAISADSLSLGGTDVSLTKDAFAAFSGGGGQPAQGEPGASQPNGGAESRGGATTQGGVKPTVALGQFALASPTKLAFTDTSVSPEVRVKADVKALRVDNLNTADPSQQTDVRLKAVLNDFTDVDASGWVAPFGAKPSFDLLAQIKKLELPPLSPYAAKAVGMNIESGQLGLQADALAKSGNLDGAVKFEIQDLNLSALSKEDAERLSAEVGMPVETVVSLLQDSQGRINLRIPISGDLTAPSFDLSDAIGQAVTGAVGAAATAPFKLLFEPVNMIANAAGGGPPSFKPIAFPAGQATLAPDGKVFADNLAKLLKERPKLSLRVCGKSTPEDLEALRAQGKLPAPAPAAAQPPPQTRPLPPQLDDQARGELTRLAEERTRAIRQYLVASKGIGDRQVSECRAAFDPKGKGGPRAEISF